MLRVFYIVSRFTPHIWSNFSWLFGV